jgi:hypothetical protein
MTKIYEIIKGDEIFTPAIKMTDENGVIWRIPIDESNSDYAEYLASLEEPNLPEVEETPETPEAE